MKRTQEISNHVTGTNRGGGSIQTIATNDLVLAEFACIIVGTSSGKRIMTNCDTKLMSRCTRNTRLNQPTKQLAQGLVKDLVKKRAVETPDSVAVNDGGLPGLPTMLVSDSWLATLGMFPSYPWGYCTWCPH